MLPYYIQDNFYSEPDKVRQFALQQTFNIEYPNKDFCDTSINKLWPGFATELVQREKFIDKSVSNLIGKPVRSSEKSGFFRISKKNDVCDVHVHVDSIPDSTTRQYQGVVYLSLPEQCLGKVGTTFLKHKKTGSIKIESASDYWFFKDDFLKKDKWDIYLSIESCYNRLVVFESNYFHNVGDIFGDNLENGRLVQILNFHEI